MIARKLVRASAVAFASLLFLLAPRISVAANESHATQRVSQAAVPETQTLACPAGSLGDLKLTVLQNSSNIGKSGGTNLELVCNYKVESNEKPPAVSGMAITIDYACDQDTQNSWTGKTGKRDQYDPKANPPVTSGEVSRSSTSLLLREDGLVDSFVGTFTVQERLFLLINSRTIATIVVNTDVKQPKPPAQPDPNMLNLNAGDAQSLGTLLASGEDQYAPKCGSASAPDDNQLAIVRIVATSPNRVGGTPIRFDEGADVQVSVGTLTKNPNKNEVVGVAGVKFQVFYDNILVGSGQTPNGSGSVFGSLTFSLPSDTAQGRSQHQVKVQVSKDNYQPAEATQQIEVWRGLENIRVLIEPLGGQFDVNQSVTVRGKVFADGPRPWGSIPVAATVSVSDGNGKLLGTAVTETGGAFSLAVQLGKGFGGVLNALDVHAIPTDASHYGDAESQLLIKMNPGKTLALTAGTDKGVYREGETVTVQGAVSSAGNPVSVDVQLVVDGAQRGAKTTDADGTFSFAFDVPTLPGQIPAPGGQHVVGVIARATGYDDGAATAYFLVGGEALSCVPLPFDVLHIKGQPTASSLITPNSIPPISAGGPTTGQTISVPKASPIAAGNKLTQDMSVRTGAQDQVVLSLPFEGGEVRIAVDAATELKIGAFCKDASGKVRLLLNVDNPGRILINIDNPQGGALPLDYKIVTPRNSVTSVGTRYLVAVDEQGATTVASFDGTVLVSDLSDANTAQVPPANQLTVPIGNSPDQTPLAPRTLAVDPALQALLTEAPVPPPPPNAGSSIAAPASNPLILIGIAGSAFAFIALLIGGILIVSRSRGHTSPANLPRPSDLPESGADRGRPSPANLPRPDDLPESGANRGSTSQANLTRPGDLPESGADDDRRQ
jgi:hypothetical protein